MKTNTCVVVLVCVAPVRIVRPLPRESEKNIYLTSILNACIYAKPSPWLLQVHVLLFSFRNAFRQNDLSAVASRLPLDLCEQGTVPAVAELDAEYK